MPVLRAQLSKDSISQMLWKLWGYAGLYLTFTCTCVLCVDLPEHVSPRVLSDCTSCLRPASCVSQQWMWMIRLPSRSSTTFTAAANQSWMGERFNSFHQFDISRKQWECFTSVVIIQIIVWSWKLNRSMMIRFYFARLCQLEEDHGYNVWRKTSGCVWLRRGESFRI